MRLLKDLFSYNPLFAAEQDYYRERNEIAAKLIREKGMSPPTAKVRAAAIIENRRRMGIDNETP